MLIIWIYLDLLRTSKGGSIINNSSISIHTLAFVVAMIFLNHINIAFWSIWSISVQISPLWFIQSISVHFVSFLSIWPNLVHFGLFWSTFVHSFYFGPFSPFWTNWILNWFFCKLAFQVWGQIFIFFLNFWIEMYEILFYLCQTLCFWAKKYNPNRY